MKTLVFLLGICTLLFACNEDQKPTVDPQNGDVITESIQEYIDANFEENQVELKSIDIDTVSPKKKLETEAMELVKQLSLLIEEGKSLKIQLDEKESHKTEVSSSDEALYASSLEQLGNRLLKNQKETRIKLTLAKELQLRSKNADSLSISYLSVHVKLTMEEEGAKKTLVLPFYFSPDGEILRKPGELMNKNGN